MVLDRVSASFWPRLNPSAYVTLIISLTPAFIWEFALFFSWTSVEVLGMPIPAEVLVAAVVRVAAVMFYLSELKELAFMVEGLGDLS